MRWMKASAVSGSHAVIHLILFILSKTEEQRSSGRLREESWSVEEPTLCDPLRPLRFKPFSSCRSLCSLCPLW